MYLEWDTSNFTTGLDLQGHAPPFLISSKSRVLDVEDRFPVYSISVVMIKLTGPIYISSNRLGRYFWFQDN